MSNKMNEVQAMVDVVINATAKGKKIDVESHIAELRELIATVKATPEAERGQYEVRTCALVQILMLLMRKEEYLALMAELQG